MMTRKDYVLIERVIARRIRSAEAYEEIVALAYVLADELAQANSSFNKDKFLKGCGL